MLNSNSDLVDGEATTDSWRVLVYDAFGRDVLAPLVKVGELRKLGVTLYLDLHSDRMPVPDVTAIYFVRPSEENVSRICADMAAGLYEAMELNAIAPLSAAHIDRLAGEALAHGCVARIRSIHDQYLGFVSLEPHLFSLHHTSSYRRLNGRTADREIEGYVDAIVDGLLAVCVTHRMTPLLRCKSGGPAHMVAEKLAARIREARLGGTELFDDSGYTPSQRPVLLLVDRSIDMAVMLQHSWTYQALVHDVCSFNLNQVSLDAPPPSGSSSAGGAAAGAAADASPASAAGRRLSYALDETDAFWTQHAATPFPEVGVLVEKMVTDYAAVVNQVKKLREKMTTDGTGDVGTTSDLMGDTRDIASNLGEHAESKRLMDMHSNIATAILRAIETRSLDAFFFAEEALRDGDTDASVVRDLLASKGAPDDKLRLFLIYFWCCAEPDAAVLASLSELLTTAGVDVVALSHLRQVRNFQRLLPRASGRGAPSKSGLSWGQLLKSGKNLLKLTGADAWLPANNMLPLTRLVSALVERKAASEELSGFVLLDPRGAAKASASAPAAGGGEPAEIFVFVVGGGNYIEAQNLGEYMKTRSAQPGATCPVLYYGTSELLPAVDFLAQLKAIGSGQ